MSSKYGVPLTDERWAGLPLRAGNFERTGKLEGLVAAGDALLVWGGGVSDVTLHSRRGARTERHRFRRRSGMLDLLPRGTIIEEVRWEGEAASCVSVGIDAVTLAPGLGPQAALEPEALRLCLMDAHVVDLVRRLQAQAHARQPWGTPYVEALSLTLASYVYGRYGTPAAVASERSLPELDSERLVEFVEEHLGEDIGLPQLAALVGYSPDHFARLFKRAFGRSPYQYLLERRVERAKSLLRDRSHSIAEIAVECGFSTQAHFHAAFKSRTGVTPGAYRKS